MHTQLIDGRAIARDIEEELKRAFSRFREKGVVPRLEVLSFGDDPATRSFLTIKSRVAERVGVELVLHELPEDTLKEVGERIVDSLVESEPEGVVIQLPLPPQIDKQTFLDRIPARLDVDCISPRSLESFSRGESTYLSPVALAVEEVLERSGVDLEGKKVAIVGYGDLVGKPTSFLLKMKGVQFDVFDSDSDLGDLRDFDVVISGVGKPGLIKGEHLKAGSVVLDAGTSESEGELLGDVHPSAQGVAALLTPVPGGVGPITVVKLFENVLSSLETKNNAQ